MTPTQRTTTDEYEGTEAELVGSEIVSRDMLPGVDGRPAGTLFFHCGQPAARVKRLDHQVDPENWVRVCSLEAGRYRVDVGLARDEKLRRLNESFARGAERDRKVRARMAAEEQRRRGREEAERARRCAAMRETDFRRTLEDALIRPILLLAGHIRGQEETGITSYPFRFEDDMQRSVFAAFRSIIRFIQEAPVARVLDTQLSAARADQSFQAFLNQQCISDTD